MKKIALLSVLFILITSVALYAGTPRSYVQKLVWAEGDILDVVQNTGITHNENFVVTADIVETPGEVLGTNLGTPISSIRICKTGNGTNVPFMAAIFLQLGTFTTQWEVGQTINMSVTYVPTGVEATWSVEIPTGTTTLLYTGDGQEQIVPGPAAPTYTLAVGANYPGAAIYLDGADTGQVTPYTFDPAEAGTYTLMMDNVVWTPADYIYAAEANAEVYFTGVYGPNAPNVTAPTEGQVFEWTEPGTVDVVWDLDPMVDYYEVKFMEEDWVAVAEGNTIGFDIADSGNYYVNVRGVKNDPAPTKIYSRVNINDRNLRSAAPASPKGAGLEASVSFSVVITPAADIPEDTPTPVGDATVTISGGSANYDMSGDIPPIPNGSIVIADQFVLELIGAGPWTIAIQTTAPWASYYSDGMWHAVENSGGLITFTVTASKGMDLPVVLADLDPTLPVELSAFNAVLTAQYFVKLTWISESETGLLGYRVYRSEDNVYDNAVSITPIMIDATNTSSTHVYTHEDREVMNNTGYYYWLEAVDMTHSTPYGPQYVEVKHDETPELPAQTVLKSAYPNPFKANSNTNIPVEVKAGESGTVTIYNVLGQVVKTFNVNEGFNPLTWNGRDSRNNACGSGIYFYKLSTPSKNQTKKMVIVK